ncbi:MAG TPA: dTDP-4-dehydrorhamnose 3,5-epimerase family protein [Acidobacteriota bacterium]|nr:dTDP-4-dehydrorhamnose 3,5-epimerase family protein [Acidobacteriota bacterium]
MRFVELALPGVWLIEPVVFADERGSFRRHFCADEFAAHGLDPAAVQGNISENPQLGTLRGLHYQIGSCAEAKTLSCLTGALYDIVLDLRPDSPMFMRWVPVRISADDRQSLHVPAGCANAWLTTAPGTTIHYYMSEMFAPESSRGIRYNDPAFDFGWPMEPKVISERDRTFPDFDPTSLGRT